MENQTRLKVTSGRADGPVAARVAEVVNATRDLGTLELAVAEPYARYLPGGRTGRIPGFQPVQIGSPNWSTDTPLSEAFLFWSRAVDHIIADAGGCRWVRLEESAQGERCQRRVRRVLLLKDLARFGLLDSDLPEQPLKAIEYVRKGRLVGWRLRLQDKRVEGGGHHD